MTRRRLVAAAALLAALPTLFGLRGGLLDRPLRMDNRIYFFIAERAASGVPPHVSAPDVKTQLSSLVDAAWIRAGRTVGMDDVHAGRIGALVALIAGIWGTGLAVFEMGATPAAAVLGAISVLAFSGLTGHATVGFNPKILLFATMAWVPWFVARGRFFGAGVAASAAMMCWQPAAALCVGVAAGSLTDDRRWRALARTVAGGLVAALAYEAWFAWHGVLAAQMFQSWVLPTGSVHNDVDWMRGARFVLFGELHGIDRVGAAAAAFALVLIAALLKAGGVPIPAPGRRAAPTSAIVALLVGGCLACAFTAYEFQAEPDRFLLCAAFAASIGLVIDRAVALLGRVAGARSVFRLEGALAALLILAGPRGNETRWQKQGSLDDQKTAGNIVAMLAETYGSVWAYGCPHLLGMAHLNNHHPVDHFWDDLRRLVDEDRFTPIAHGRLPDVILRCRRLPGGDRLAAQYVGIPLPGLASEKVHAFVRAGAGRGSAP